MVDPKHASTSAYLEAAKRHLYGNYRPAPIVLARGEGSVLFDVDGKRYVDMAAGVAVCALGHAHPAWVRAVAEQAARVAHVSNYFFNDRNIELAEALARISGFDRALFCNSGAEANEALFKLARRHFYGRGEATRRRIVAFHHAFHGRTMGALSMTGTAKYREGFGEVEGVVHVDYGDMPAVERELARRDVAAVIVETVQGEGGVLPAPPGFLEALREACDSHGTLLFCDEVQTGFGRTGEWFGFMHTKVRPDAISVAKGLGGGFPIGAMLTTEALADALPPGTHGTTFGGNALACAAALAVIETMERERIIERVRERGAYLDGCLAELVRAFPDVCEGARGQGLLRGLVLREGFVVRTLLPQLVERGVLLTAAGDRVVRFVPPLIVSEGELDEAVAALREVLALARATAA